MCHPLLAMTFALTGLGLAGCANVEDPFETARPATTAEKRIVLATARNELYDPFSIRDAELSEVIVVKGNAAPRRIVCARYDSKRKDGDYTGRETHLVAISSTNAVMSSIIVPDTEMPCDRLQYAPFPEADDLKRG